MCNVINCANIATMADSNLISIKFQSSNKYFFWESVHTFLYACTTSACTVLYFMRIKYLKLTIYLSNQRWNRRRRERKKHWQMMHRIGWSFIFHNHQWFRSRCGQSNGRAQCLHTYLIFLFLVTHIWINQIIMLMWIIDMILWKRLVTEWPLHCAHISWNVNGKHFLAACVALILKSDVVFFSLLIFKYTFLVCCAVACTAIFNWTHNFLVSFKISPLLKSFLCMVLWYNTTSLLFYGTRGGWHMKYKF